MNLDLWSILIIVIASQGIFLGISLAIRAKPRRSGDGYLLAIVAVLTWFLLEFLAIRNTWNLGLALFYGTRYGSWFLLGPLIYFYFKSITRSNWKMTSKDLWHFAPFVIFVIVIPLIAYKVLNDRQVDYGMLSVFDHREKVITPIQYVYSVVFILQFFHLGFFLLKNLRVLGAYKQQLHQQFSDGLHQIRWLKTLSISLLVLLIFAAVFLYILLVTDIYRRHLDYIYVLPIGLLFYFISFKLIRTQWRPVELPAKYAGSSLDSSEVPSHLSRLNGLLEVEKVYLDSELSLAKLAERMQMNKNHLSQMMNQHLHQSFYDLINKYRVAEAKDQIAQQQDATFIQIAFEVGFNNKTSFVNAFRKFEGCTPSQYRSRLSS